MTLQSRAITPRQSPLMSESDRRLMAAYRAQISGLVQMEQELVERRLLKPEERRILSREERRAGAANTNGRDNV